MGILTFILICMVAWTIYHALPILTGNIANVAKTKSNLIHIRTLGTLAIITGLLGQLIGLYSAFDVMEEVGDISQSLLAGGLKVSTIPTVYGMLIFIISLILWLIFDTMLNKKSE